MEFAVASHRVPPCPYVAFNSSFNQFREFGPRTIVCNRRQNCAILPLCPLHILGTLF